MLKFLVDECLSPALAGRARQRGFEAFHVNWLQKTGFKDYALMPYVLGGDYVFVTNNGVDFKTLYNALEVHPGLIILLDVKSRDRQIGMFMAVIDYLEDNADTVNKLIEVDSAMGISVRDYPDLRSNRK